MGVTNHLLTGMILRVAFSEANHDDNPENKWQTHSMSLVEKKLKLTTLPPLKIQACFLPESFKKDTEKKRSEGDLKKDTNRGFGSLRIRWDSFAITRCVS